MSPNIYPCVLCVRIFYVHERYVGSLEQKLNHFHVLCGGTLPSVFYLSLKGVAAIVERGDALPCLPFGAGDMVLRRKVKWLLDGHERIGKWSKCKDRNIKKQTIERQPFVFTQ